MAEVANRRNRRRQEERRQQILTAALDMFGEKGFHATNVSDVASRAGISQGTIYLYFKSKDEPLRTCHTFVLRRVRPAKHDRDTTGADGSREVANSRSVYG